ncbi:hypothetical protein [Paenarthrobacter ureafaciens]|uniref:hypothetical protein n=1 Tax=Paenarthrobacter ureafaciens TaxID=37931 RepID=UPI001FB315E6|nr:hypothetical protein [Paenarthrobacter ureafaciens]UOD80332.1 hypothetical protein MQZ73_14585 [Paenarthrobacter ureafaciens]WNZ02985.1 hypothetical protein PVT25_15225 [Paenarthrobacter ureafaciens]
MSNDDALDAGIDLTDLMAGEWKPEPVAMPRVTGYGTKHTDLLTGVQIAREYDKTGRLISEWRKAPGEDSKWVEVKLYTTYTAPGRGR